jgi:replicative DNA helicase
MNAPELHLPPHHVESEQSIIGALMLDQNAFDRIADIITPGDFYTAGHGAIFSAIRNLHAQGKPVDVVTVAEILLDAGEDDRTGLAYLGELAANTPSAANIRHYAEVVRKNAILRGLLGVAGSIQDACLSQGPKDAEKIALEAESAMLSLIDRQGGEPATLSEVFAETITYLDDHCQRGDDLAGLATGFDGFDHLTGGLEPGQLIIVAARPSVGKTMFGVNIADRLAQRGLSTLFFTLELSRREIGLRLLSTRTGLPVQVLRARTNDQTLWSRLANEQGKAEKQRLFIDDKGAIGVGYVRAKARRIKRKNGLDLIVVDYLGLMKGQGDNRTQEIGSLSRGLKALAKELSVPIIALAQLNRGVENRTDKRPMLSDLRDSGEVEQDADIVAMLHREALHSPAPEWDGLAELLVRKNRNGPTGEILLTYRPEVMRFDDAAQSNPRRTTTTSGNSRGGYTRGFSD